ncbi:ent-kaurene oxidase [Pyrenophora seminiperda CCB06]|uniref:Ent-kaurene oxidase n=1 Tax=Pyrenophora seminiperda CCB06 TaxID=1302712 RepID=A0A3M7LVG6_9PLEO|nr:ent-kaurene oxidase [Pyrenophora seminiperda CCB06]
MTAPFVVTWWRLDYLILPTKYLPDLQRVKPENASFLKNFSDAVNAHYSVGKLYESDRMGDIIRKGLKPALPSLTPVIMEEAKRAIEMEIGSPKEWKSFTTVELVIMISHRVVSRLIAGEQLARNEKFLRLSRSFADSLMMTGMAIAVLPLGPLRKPLGWLMAQYHRWTLQKVVVIAEPVIAERLAEAREGKDCPQYNDSIEWAIRLDTPPERDSRTMTLEMLHILEAAGGAPGAMMSEMIYQLLAEPEYIQPLEEELKAALASSESLNDALQKCPLMESFIMETNRMYPVGGVTAARTVMNEPWVLHDGTVLPVGTRIGFPCKAIQRNPANFQDASRFDGFRFARLNEAEGKTQHGAIRYAADASTPTNMSWGFGRHACPGRFYAIRLAKMVFMVLLSEYEFKWDGKPPTAHPASFEIEGQFLPNLQQRVCFRKKEKSSI